ncbi:glycosyltransferase family 2 protein [Hyphobacterium sp. CCMP332]|nr:glycosyltransferase family 2 protein [Hyphobacterium sp. CCMP332]
MPSNKPGLSVLLSAYNSEKFIQQAIESILNQSFEDFELLIADDGSSDNTKSIIDSFSDHRIIRSHNSSNKGKINTCNRLFTLAKGDFVSIHDADDYSHKDRFAKQLQFIKSKSLAMCGTDFVNLTESGKILQTIKMPNDIEVIKQNFLKVSQFHGPTMMIQKDVVEQVGGLYRFFRNKEDVDLAVRITERFPVDNLNEALYYYRNHPASLSKQGYDFLKFEGMKAIEFLHNERMHSEDYSDSLMKSDRSAFEQFLKQLEKPYRIDKGLIYRKSAAHNMYFNFFRAAISQSFKAIAIDPFRIINYRTFLYCVRKSVFKI